MKRAFLLLAACVSCRTAGAPVTPPAVDDGGAASASSTMPITPPGPDVPFPDAGSCQMTQKYLALPPAQGKCDEPTCAAAGGTCAWGGLTCYQVCARRTRDAGKACHDKNDCEGTCVAPKDATRGTRTAGKCSEGTVNWGCTNRVEMGVAQGEMCAD